MNTVLTLIWCTFLRQQLTIRTPRRLMRQPQPPPPPVHFRICKATQMMEGRYIMVVGVIY